MNDTNSIERQAWVESLRHLMGYPAHARIASVTGDMPRDPIHLAFTDDTAEPIGISLAIQQDTEIIWLTGVRLYSAAAFAKVELLAGNRRWHVGPRYVLTAVKLPPINRRARGEEIAMRRWRKAAAAIDHVGSSGSTFVRSGTHEEAGSIRAQFDIAA